MLKLYYTGPKTYLGTQKNPESSLGGYPSVSLVPNEYQGNVFGDISLYTKHNEITTVIGLILKNELDLDLSNVSFYFDLPSGIISTYKVAAVSMSQDSDSQYYMEEIPNQNASPVYATFHEADGLVNAVDLGPIESGKMIGIWLKRIVSDTIKTDDELYDDFVDESDAATTENIGLNFVYDESDIESSSS